MEEGTHSLLHGERKSDGSSVWKSTVFKVGAFVVVSLLAVGSFIALMVVLNRHQESHEKKRESPCPLPPTVVDSTNDFPLYPPSPWNITANHTRSLKFTVSTGTWISLDISPNGSVLVFDMVGDIYTLPVNGGTATLLRGGVAWETQPRFSPDGTKLLFCSDLTGLDNLWILELSSGRAWPLTNETFHWVSDGRWSPDGQSVIATKWYTSERSLGAGELWTYDVVFYGTGDSLTLTVQQGRQVVGRVSPDAQVGPEEPVYSPDAKYLYYSQNVMNSLVWTYNNNPHEQIYVVKQRELSTNTTVTVAGGYGGAARPMPSRDGTRLAYIRRVEFNSTLVIQDLTNGNEVIAYMGLSFDQQESYTPYGVYPAYVWASNDTEILIWDGTGGIVRLNTIWGNTELILFTVDIALELAETARANVSAATTLPGQTTFTVRAIQSPSVVLSTRGDIEAVAFSAVGSIYTVSGSVSNIPQRLTTQNDSYEFSPCYAIGASDYISYITWNDSTYGTVQLRRLSTGAQWTVMASAADGGPQGRYVEPQVFAVDSGHSLKSLRVAFRRTGGTALSGDMYTKNPGIYVAELNDTTPAGAAVTGVMVTANGRSPRWDASGQSLFVVRGGYPEISLVRVPATANHNTAEEVTIATSKYATDFYVSPDESLLAFVEFENLYVTPLGKKRAGGSSLKNGPLAVSARPGYCPPDGVLRVSVNGAAFAGWATSGSADTNVLYWQFGSVLYYVSQKELSKCLSTSSSATPSGNAAPSMSYGLECLSPHIRSVNFTLTIPAAGMAPSDSIICYTNATIVTMRGGNTSDILSAPSTLVVTGTTVTALGPADTVTCPTGARTVDVDGGVILPGFIDVHAHWSGGADAGFSVQQDWEMVSNLAYGVTTTHNPSIDSVDVFTDAELIRAGRKLGPRIFSTGTIIYGAGGPYHTEIGSLNDALAVIQRRQAYGAFSVKSYNQPRRSSRQMLLAAARQLGVDVVPEGGMAFQWNLNQIVDGHTTIEHSLPMAPLFDDAITLFAASGTGYTPTLIVNYGGLWGERYWYQVEDVWSDPFGESRFAPIAALEARSMRREKAADKDYHHFATSASVKSIIDAGGVVEVGAHGQLSGIGYHWELWMLAQGGTAPERVLASATYWGAKALGLRDVGALDVGMLADAVIYRPEHNPMIDIHTTHLPWMVMKDGRVYDALTVNQLYPTEVPRPSGPILNTPKL